MSLFYTWHYITTSSDRMNYTQIITECLGAFFIICFTVCSVTVEWRCKYLHSWIASLPFTLNSVHLGLHSTCHSTGFHLVWGIQGSLLQTSRRRHAEALLLIRGADFVSELLDHYDMFAVSMLSHNWMSKWIMNHNQLLFTAAHHTQLL